MARGGGRRTYVRDGRGRFASTPGGGAPKRPPTRRASRSPGRLTRDNAGRITSIGGNGATARGGRLRTAAGNLRARQVDRLRVAPIKGAVTRAGKRRGPQREAVKPATPSARPTGRFESLGFRPGVFMSAYGRPVGVIGMPKRGRRQYDPWTRFAGPQHAEANLKAAEQWAQSKGIKTYRYKAQTGNFAQASPGNNAMGFNEASYFWAAPRAVSRELRRSRWWSTSAPLTILYHELGHVRDNAFKARFIAESNASDKPAMNFNTWKAVVPSSYGGPFGILQRSRQMRDLANRVSGYAVTSPAEFIAETYAGLRSGIRYDHQVMRAYREAMGLPARPPARHRSRRRKPQS